MNSPLLETLAAASRVAACRQARTMQQGVGFRGGYLSNAGFVLSGSRTFECLFRVHDPGTEFLDNQFLFSSYPLVRAPRAYVQKGELIVGMTNDIVAVGSLEVGPWHHLVEVVDASARTLTVYFDGELAGTKRLAEALEDNQTLYIGSWGPALLNRGDVALFRAFGAALGAAEASALWHGGAPEDFVVPAAMKSLCAAEFVARNLTEGCVWLDSASQQPFDDACLPPLLCSAGGRDLSVGKSGVEIIFRE